MFVARALIDVSQHDKQWRNSFSNWKRRCDQTSIKNSMSSNLSELHNLEEMFKIELVSKATEFCRLEKEQNEETTRMAKDQDKLQKKHEIELAEFRLQAEIKKKAQRKNILCILCIALASFVRFNFHLLFSIISSSTEDVSRKLESDKANVERQSNEHIAQLEDEVEESVSQMINKFEQEIDHERVSAERLHCENSILRRRIGKTMDDINGLKERVSSLLHQDEETQKEIRSREEERQKLAEVKSKKDKDLASKNNAVIRLNHNMAMETLSFQMEIDGSINKSLAQVKSWFTDP